MALLTWELHLLVSNMVCLHGGCNICVHVGHAMPTLVFVEFYFVLVKCFVSNKHKIHHVHNALNK